MMDGTPRGAQVGVWFCRGVNQVTTRMAPCLLRTMNSIAYSLMMSHGRSFNLLPPCLPCSSAPLVPLTDLIAEQIAASRDKLPV